MRNWLQTTLQGCVLTDEMEGYLYGRGATSERIESFGLRTWKAPPIKSPDPVFESKFGDCGAWVGGWLTCPLYSPKGVLIGVEFRNTIRKRILYYMLEPDSKWIAPWIGTQQAMPELWDGFEVWIVEGMFDLFALDWVVPKGVTLLSSLKARLTKNHIRFLKRFAPSVCMVYDLDDAGQRGTRKALYDLKEAEVKCRSLTYTGGKDPGEVWDKFGVEGLGKSFNTAYYIRGVN